MDKHVGYLEKEAYPETSRLTIKTPYKGPPARRSARLLAVAAQRSGPSYPLPGQAVPTEPRGNKTRWVSIQSANHPKNGSEFNPR